MAIKVHDCELGPTIGGSAANPRASAKFYVDGIATTDTVDDVIQAVIQYAASTVTFRVPMGNGVGPPYGQQWLYTLLYLDSVVPKMLSHDQAEAMVEWGVPRSAPAPQNGEKKPSNTPTNQALGPEYQFDTQGGTKHVTQSVKTRWRGLASGLTVAGDAVDPDPSITAPFLNRAIGVTNEGVQGVDIYAGDQKWSVQYKNVPVTLDYIHDLAAITGTINSDKWFGRKPGELLFLGASGGWKAGDGWCVTYHFHEKENRTNVEVAGIIFPTIMGHDYLWFMYEKSAVGPFSVMVPSAAYCEQVYEESHFSRLEDFT